MMTSRSISAQEMTTISICHITVKQEKSTILMLHETAVWYI